MSDETPPLLPSRAEVKKNWTTSSSYQASIRWPVDGPFVHGDVVPTTARVEASLRPVPRIVSCEGHQKRRWPAPKRDGTDG